MNKDMNTETKSRLHESALKMYDAIIANALLDSKTEGKEFASLIDDYMLEFVMFLLGKRLSEMLDIAESQGVSKETVTHCFSMRCAESFSELQKYAKDIVGRD